MKLFCFDILENSISPLGFSLNFQKMYLYLAKDFVIERILWTCLFLLKIEKNVAVFSAYHLRHNISDKIIKK